MMTPGDLIKNNMGVLAQVTRGGYTYRFMEAQDYEMEEHGMGEYAGVYGTAYDITYLSGPDAGKGRRVQLGKGGWGPVPAEGDES